MANINVTVSPRATRGGYIAVDAAGSITKAVDVTNGLPALPTGWARSTTSDEYTIDFEPTNTIKPKRG